LKEITDSLGRKIDIVAFDACLMGMIEVAQECKEVANIMVASEETEPGDGWPYKDILSVVVDTLNGDISPEEFSRTIVEKYLESYNEGSQGKEDVTQSAIKLGNELATLVASIDTFAKVLIDSGSNFEEEIFLARVYSQEYEIYHHIDLYHFASIIEFSTSGILQQSAQKVMTAIENAVLANGYVGEKLMNSYGTAIYYPADSTKYDTTYNNLVFANNTYWNEFISKWGRRVLYPPKDVFAGSGFNASVPLTWKKPKGTEEGGKLEQSFKGYKIYRGESSGGPYSLIATILKGDRVGNPLENFIDTEVNNGTTYYYVLTALYDGEESILRSDEVSATPNAPGYIKNSKFRTTQPTIDGVINTGEWSDAETLNVVTPSGSMASPYLVYMKNDSSHLYLAIKNVADTIHQLLCFSRISIYFDENHDHNWHPTDSLAEGVLDILACKDIITDQFVTSLMFKGHYGSYPDTVLFCEDSTVEGITISSSISTGHLQLEMAIDLTKSPLNAKVGDTIGISLKYSKSFFLLYSFSFGEWPYGTIYTGPRSFGDLVLATSANVEEREKSSVFSLYQNCPNPFSLGTKIMYQIPVGNTNVSLKIFDISGRNVRDIRISHKKAGTYTIYWDGKDNQGKDLPNGIYFYRLETKEKASIRKMTLIR
jgi:hypothetical protein